MHQPDLDRMGFPLRADHHDIRDMMLRLGQDRLAPGAATRDRERAFPVTEITELAKLGGMAMKTTEADGGPGLDTTGYALAIEAIARFDASVAVIMVASNLSAGILAAAADADQRTRFLRPLAQGEIGAASFALTEPGAGSDAAAIRTRARRDGDGWVLEGAKQFITGATQAELFVVFARTGDVGEKPEVTCFVVEKGTPGFTLGRAEETMGLRSSGTAMLHFDDARIPDANRIGGIGAGYKVAMAALAPSRVAIAAQSIGIAERAFELGRAHARDRHIFGRAVSDFQANAFALADARMGLDQSWLMMLRAAYLVDSGARISAEASMAKLVASETCGLVVDRMLQLHGGAGYTVEYEIERLYRDARVMRIFEGTSEVQRDLIAREVLAG